MGGQLHAGELLEAGGWKPFGVAGPIASREFRPLTTDENRTGRKEWWCGGKSVPEAPV